VLKQKEVFMNEELTNYYYQKLASISEEYESLTEDEKYQLDLVIAVHKTLAQKSKIHKLSLIMAAVEIMNEEQAIQTPTNPYINSN